MFYKEYVLVPRAFWLSSMQCAGPAKCFTSFGSSRALTLPHEVESVLDLIFTIEENEPQRGRDLPIQ